MGKEEDWNVNEFIKTARTPERQRELRQALEDIKEELDVKEIRRNGGVYLRMHHKPTGIEVEKKCRASRQATYLETINELIDKLPEDWK